MAYEKTVLSYSTSYQHSYAGFLRYRKVDKLINLSDSNLHVSPSSLLFNLHRFTMKIYVFYSYAGVVPVCQCNTAVLQKHGNLPQESMIHA